MKVIKIIFITLSILWTFISLIVSLIISIPVLLLTIWFKNKLFLNSMLLVLAKTMAVGLFPMGFIYKILKVIITSESKTEHLSQYIRKVAIADDQKGNVVIGPLLNDSLITKDGYQYGDEDETISSATGKNVVKETQTVLGKKFNLILELFEEGHSVNSIENF